MLIEPFLGGIEPNLRIILGRVVCIHTTRDEISLDTGRCRRIAPNAGTPLAKSTGEVVDVIVAGAVLEKRREAKVLEKVHLDAKRALPVRHGLTEIMVKRVAVPVLIGPKNEAIEIPELSRFRRQRRQVIAHELP